MRTHSQIVKDIGPDKVSELTGSPINTVRSWIQRDSVPSDHWLVLVTEEHCTAEELMAGAAKARAA